MNKLKVGILFGGRSPEHEISLLSASRVLAALDPKKYEIIPIGIDKQGIWLLVSKDTPLLDTHHPSMVHLNTKITQQLLLVPSQKSELKPLSNSAELGHLDVIFPVLHGPLGEDGTIQGLLQFVDIPYVGPGVLGSAVCMDKEISKLLFKQLNIQIAKFRCFRSNEKEKMDFKQLTKELGSPLFIKPANLGSSVGVYKARDEKEFHKAVVQAFAYDHKILVEEAILGREIEVALLGNDDPEVSLVGEAIPNDEFYTYKAKYEEDGVDFVVPAVLPPHVAQTVQQIAKQAFKALECRGMARADFFVKGNEVYLNELNTIPGLTKTSAYPLLWQASGLSMPALVDKLIELALQAHKKDKELRRSYDKGGA